MRIYSCIISFLVGMLKKNEKLQHFDIVVIISIAEFSGSTILGDTYTRSIGWCFELHLQTMVQF